MEKITFKELQLKETILKAIEDLGYENPSQIQAEAIPLAIAGNDIIGQAQTGTGKTAAFGCSILNNIKKGNYISSIILTPTRELAFQIAEQFDALGASVQLKTAVIVGGVDMVQQALALARKPHVVIATPGRLVDHLENTKGFTLRNTKFLVLDEADRMLSMDFEEEINKILEALPKERRTYLFSATMTQKVAKLQRASLHNPVKLQVSTKYQTVSTLIQQVSILEIMIIIVYVYPCQIQRLLFSFPS